MRTNIDGVGDFIDDILEAAEFYWHLHAGADFSTTWRGPSCHRDAFSRWEMRRLSVRAGCLNKEIRRSLHCVFNSTLGQCPDDMLPFAGAGNNRVKTLNGEEESKGDSRMLVRKTPDAHIR